MKPSATAIVLAITTSAATSRSIYFPVKPPSEPRNDGQEAFAQKMT